MTAIFTVAPYFVRQSSVDDAHRKRKPHSSPNALYCPAGIGVNRVTTEDCSPGTEADPVCAMCARRAPE
jgi:hypothetical protein